MEIKRDIYTKQILIDHPHGLILASEEGHYDGKLEDSTIEIESIMPAEEFLYAPEPEFYYRRIEDLYMEIKQDIYTNKMVIKHRYGLILMSAKDICDGKLKELIMDLKNLNCTEAYSYALDITELIKDFCKGKENEPDKEKT